MDAASERVFDALLVDLAMPGMDGYQLANAVRELCAVKPAIFAVTGLASAEDVKRSKDEGFHAHLVKPVDPRELAALLRDTCRS